MESLRICPTSLNIIVPLIIAMKNHLSNRHIQVFCVALGHKNNKSQFIEGFVPVTIIPFCRQFFSAQLLTMRASA